MDIFYDRHSHVQEIFILTSDKEVMVSPMPVCLSAGVCW